MREIPDFQLCDLLSPHFLFVVLPLMILICPFNLQAVAAHEFQAARAAHFELGGQLFGSKNAAINMEARAVNAGHVLRKVVVAKAQDVTPARLEELASSGAGGLIVVLPKLGRKMSTNSRNAILALEDNLLTNDYEMPVYFTQESAEINQLEKQLREDSTSDGKPKAGAEVLLDNIISNGFQIVSNGTVTKQLNEQALANIQGYLPGKGEPENLPTVLVVAHYDAGGAAPAYAVGADANGSGATILLELARIFGELYKKNQPEFNIVFLLSGGGKLNYYGSKKWLENQRDFQDNSQNSDFLSNVKLVVCLDGLGLEDSINLHVSKPPKEGTAAHKFVKDLEGAASAIYSGEAKVNVVHKKINLAQDLLAWEHERFSIAKLSAVTLSHFAAYSDAGRSTMTDTFVDQKVLARNAHLVGHALACTVYGQCPQDTTLAKPKSEKLQEWTDLFAKTPRGYGMVSGAKNPFVKTLLKAMDSFVVKAKQLMAVREKRDADYTLYDSPVATINSYNIKPAVFDLVLTMGIAAYLAVVYGVVSNGPAIYAFFAAFVSPKEAVTPTKRQANGKSKAH